MDGVDTVDGVHDVGGEDVVDRMDGHHFNHSHDVLEKCKCTLKVGTNTP